MGDRPRAGIVNRTLDDFVEFLYRFAHLEHTESSPIDRKREYTAQLRGHLQVSDPQGFAHPESWWSMIFDQITWPPGHRATWPALILVQ